MKNSKHYYLTFKRLIFATIGITVSTVFTGGKSHAQQEGKIVNEPFLPQINRMVINEIMADPTPVTGLPDAEWIELFNQSEVPLRLMNWKIRVGTVQKILPDSLLPAGEYVVVCSSLTAPEMRKFGRTIVLESFPALRNSGNLVLLKDEENNTVDSIQYSDKWYMDASKREGGWSLERIDPSRDCGQALNWRASQDPGGGTPGRRNSIFRENRDLTPPGISSATVIHPQAVEIRFSECMDTRTTGNKLNFHLSEGLGHPDSLSLSGEETIRLSWKNPLAVNLKYLLTTRNLTDLCGNGLTGNEIGICRIVLKTGDLLINEILFDPWPGGSDFIEIYNNSEQEIPLDKIIAGSRNPTGAISNTVPLSGTQHSIPPGEVRALTTDTSGIFRFYPSSFHHSLFQVSRLPAFNNDKGTVVLLSDSLSILDELTYSVEMHSPLMVDPEGISLERVSPERAASDPGNWHSAASAAGFATPGYKNSQFCTQPGKRTRLHFSQDHISPNYDGYMDELVIGYELPSPGWFMTCRVFNASGILQFCLINNALAGTSGKLIWNGKNERGQLLQPGPYLMHMELFHLSGQKESHRKVVVLTAR